MADRLIVKGAREHNLRSVDLDLPRDALIVFTGLSGSGKSSLAFDTIFAEGQRRYVESLSAYARQFLGQMDKPDVDFIEGLSPAVSIDQKSTNRNPRSTVGTITEVYDYLRLLYARAGTPHCPTCGERVARQTPQQIVDQVLAMPEGTRFLVLAPVVRTRKGEFADLFDKLNAPVLQPGAGRRCGASADRSAEAEKAGKARHRGGGGPSHRQGRRQAAAHRFGGNRAEFGRRDRGARIRRS
ncbi:excinuclease ABC (subunit A-DNA-binding ATPase) uvrA [Mycobacterium tuberculosis CCDC5079]|nr:excinuclease ABC (subunit A-DNA-binding ATPase) uvrA [Mycobacterium tuberculosis CCDC5079]